MSQPYVGEIRIFAGNFPPLGWAFCDGALLSIAENTVLFELIGTTYGGDGQNTYALPDLRGRLPLHQGPGYVIGQPGGTETVTLTSGQMAAHDHILNATTTAASAAGGPTGVLAATTGLNLYGTGSASIPMDPAAVGAAGGGQPHDNMAPFLALNFIISLFGIFPTQS